MRTKIIAGNWKMNKTYAEALMLAAEVKEAVKKTPNADNMLTIVAPPFPFLSEIVQCMDGIDGVFVAAQNCHHAASGAYTGEVSAAMVQSTGATHVIIGHSERRQYFGETNEILLLKVLEALKHGLTPIFCFGETLDQRTAGEQEKIVAQQLEVLFALTPEDARKTILAYEPVWAIGTGITATPDQAQEMHAFIRSSVAKKFGAAQAALTTILYGGSCNAGNAKNLFDCADIDGGLIGGASLKAPDFDPIRKAMIACLRQKQVG